MRLLCLHCREISDVEQTETESCCPVCGDVNIPAYADDTVTLTLTTHELRILTMWAANWAAKIDTTPDAYYDAAHVITGICDHLAQYTDAPLTLTQEFADLRATFPDATVTVYRDGQETDL